MVEHLVDDSVFLGFLGGHEIIAVRVLFDFFQRLAGVFGQQPVQSIPQPKDPLGPDLDVRGLSLRPAQGLVNHHFAVGKGKAFSLGTCGEQEGPHGSGQTDADGLHVGFDMLHRVVDGHARADGSAGGIDVQVNVLFRIFGGQEEELGNHEVGHLVVDGGAQENDPVLEKTGVDIVGSFAATGLFNDDGNQCRHGLLPPWGEVRLRQTLRVRGCPSPAPSGASIG